jgi:hypothetical protein
MAIAIGIDSRLQSPDHRSHRTVVIGLKPVGGNHADEVGVVFVGAGGGRHAVDYFRKKFHRIGGLCRSVVHVVSVLIVGGL